MNTSVVASVPESSPPNTPAIHGLFLVTNHQVAFIQFTFHLIQRNERGSFRHCLYNYFIAFYLSGIEAMQRLTESMNDIISNIHYIINRTHPDQTQFVSAIPGFPSQ